MKLDIFSGKKIIVTGHTGFKGSWLSLWLSKLGASVVGISKDIPTTPSHFMDANIAKYLEDLRFDILDEKKIKEVVLDVQPDFIFHLAAQSLVRMAYDRPLDTWQTNLIGTVNLMEALRSLRKKCVAILITSDKCYENTESIWGYRETDRLGGSDPYSASKGATELAIKSYVDSFFNNPDCIRIGVARAGNVIGGGDWARDRIVPDCIRAWAAEKKVFLRQPMATRPWQHVLEPLSGYLNLAFALNESEYFHGSPFNFGPQANQNFPVVDLVDKLAEYWGGVNYEMDGIAKGDVRETGLLKLNCDKAMHFLKWESTWDFFQTVEKTSMWYKAYYEMNESSLGDYSSKQIDEYVSSAIKKGAPWAQ